MTMVSQVHGEAPDFSSSDQCSSQTSPVCTSDAVQSWAGISSAPSRFEGLAALAATLPATRGDLLRVLLASTFPIGCGGCEVLRPLWAEEAMHRAYGFVRLVDARNIRRQLTGSSPMIAGLESIIARDLAARFIELEGDGERGTRPSGAVLRDVVTGLGTLFGRPSGVKIATEIEPMSLPSYKRRALVLAASELVVNSLLHAFKGRRRGLIKISLTANAGKSMSLRVADDGIGFTGEQPNLDCGVAAALAGLLEADLEYERKAGRTIAEIEFPVAGSYRSGALM